MMQDFLDYEVIVVNDGSTDSSEQLVSNFVSNKVNLINQSNKGVSSARNLGIKEANGRWIAFLDSDDEWSKEHLSELKSLIDDFDNVNLVATKSRETHSSHTASSTSSLFSKPHISSKESKQELVDVLRFIIDKPGFIHSSSVAIKKSALLELGGFKNVKFGEDTELYCRVYLKYKCAVSYKETSLYHRGTGGVMELNESSNNFKEIKNLFDVRYAAGVLSNKLSELSGKDKESAEYFINGSVYNCFKSNLYCGNFKAVKFLPLLFVTPKKTKFILAIMISKLPIFMLSMLFKSRCFLKLLYFKIKIKIKIKNKTIRVLS